jgi:hypothetical protein
LPKFYLVVKEKKSPGPSNCVREMLRFVRRKLNEDEAATEEERTRGGELQS